MEFTSSRNAKSTLVRRLSEAWPHSANAARAASTAASTSAFSASRTSACCAPVAGLKTGAVRVELPDVSLPAIQCWMVLMLGVLRPWAGSG